MELYVATNGNNAWSGRLPAPNRTKTDGPLASVQGARDRIRRLKGSGPSEEAAGPAAALCDPVTVWVRGGRYELDAPIVFEPQDSHPVAYAAYRDEKPVIDGGVRIQNWTNTTVNGRAAWVADIPDVRAGKWQFRELFVNGRRASRPRLPREGLFRMAEAPGMKVPAAWGNGGQTQFVCRAGDVGAFTNLNDVEVVYLHFWIEERSPIAAFDPSANLVTMKRPSRSGLVGSHGSQLADYYLDNVFEALTEPGQWYLNRASGKLYYLPRPGESPSSTEVFAPRILQFLALLGNPDKNRFVEFLRFRGLTFRHTDWRHPAADGDAAILGSSSCAAAPFSRRHSRGNTAAAAQAACDVPGVIAMEAARSCAVEDCTVEHAGWYGVEIGDACRSIRVVGNTIRDLGAGGVKINGASVRDPESCRRTGEHRVTDNTIAAAGRIFHSAVGVLSMNAYDVVIAHNDIHDLFYSGVSCGWEWGYQDNASRDNRIEFNHIYHIGQGLLSDMGGIYTLGVQPGTVIRGNLIHDVRSAHYGGWCIYPDEGSSHILIEDNVCYDADRNAFHQHYGRENVIVNNIFAFGGEAGAVYSRSDADHLGFTMLRNIFVTDGVPILATGYSHRLKDRRFRSDTNLFFDVSGKPPVFKDAGGRIVSLAEWKELGYDTHSLVADPKFRDLNKRDFTLRRESPALKLGFRPIDVSHVGPRAKGKRD